MLKFKSKKYITRQIFQAVNNNNDDNNDTTIYKAP